MKSKFVNLLIVLLSTTTLAQSDFKRVKVDMDSVKKQVSSEKSEYYYPKLLKRYSECDPNLTNYEYRLIYYGFVFQDDYIKNKPYEDEMLKLAKNKEYEKVITECRKILKKNPVSLRANHQLGYALFKTEEEQGEWEKYRNRYYALRKAIMSSGDGLSPETAIKVIYISDEYNIIRTYLEIKNIKMQSLVGTCDMFEVEESKYYKANKIYFDISSKLIREQELLENSYND